MIPSKHHNKAFSGRQMRKTASGRRLLKRVGGRLMLVDAIAASATTALCHTREEVTTNNMGPTTWDLGGTLSPRSSGAQRGQ